MLQRSLRANDGIQKAPCGTETISTLGLGMDGIQSAAPDEIEAVIREAITHGIIFLTFVRRSVRL